MKKRFFFFIFLGVWDFPHKYREKKGRKEELQHSHDGERERE